VLYFEVFNLTESLASPLWPMTFRLSNVLLAGLLAIAPVSSGFAQSTRQPAGVQLGQSGWQSFTSKEGRFTVQAPLTPTSETTSTTVSGKSLDWQVAKMRNGAELYAVAYTDLPLSVLALGKEPVLESLKGRLLTSDFDWKAIALRGHRISLGNIPGMEYLSLRNGQVTALRLYLVNRRVYGVLAKASTLDQVSQFMDSFQVASIWQPFTSRTGKFTVKVPMTPIVTTEVVKTPNHTFSWSKFEARNLYAKDDTYVVAFADLPPKLVKAGVDTALTEATRDTLTALGIPAMATQGRTISLNGMPGREFMGTTNAGRSLVMRFYLSGNRLYGVFVGSQSLENLDNFLSSFQVL
jgi:hypothetical protein